MSRRLKWLVSNWYFLLKNRLLLKVTCSSSQKWQFLKVKSPPKGKLLKVQEFWKAFLPNSDSFQKKAFIPRYAKMNELNITKTRYQRLSRNRSTQLLNPVKWLQRTEKKYSSNWLSFQSRLFLKVTGRSSQKFKFSKVTVLKNEKSAKRKVVKSVKVLKWVKSVCS